MACRLAALALVLPLLAQSAAAEADAIRGHLTIGLTVCRTELPDAAAVRAALAASGLAEVAGPVSEGWAEFAFAGAAGAAEIIVAEGPDGNGQCVLRGRGMDVTEALALLGATLTGFAPNVPAGTEPVTPATPGAASLPCTAIVGPGARQRLSVLPSADDGSFATCADDGTVVIAITPEPLP